MKILIISDIHANFEALSAIGESYDELWVLGDLVNYGPDPGPVVDYIKSKATLIVRGNHDNSVGFDEDPRCSARFQKMAEATRRFTETLLNFGQKHFLRSLPAYAETQRGSTRFYLCHAIPSDPLFGYCEADSAQWLAEVENIEADIILVGHTHVPAVRSIGSCLVVNPGSLGQPKTGGSDAHYAVWEDGKVELKSCPYPVESVVAKVRAMPIDAGLREELITILYTGNIPPARENKEHH
jgi:protein phosphatase